MLDKTEKINVTQKFVYSHFGPKTPILKYARLPKIECQYQNEKNKI